MKINDLSRSPGYRNLKSYEFESKWKHTKRTSAHSLPNSPSEHFTTCLCCDIMWHYHNSLKIWNILSLCNSKGKYITCLTLWDSVTDQTNSQNAFLYWTTVGLTAEAGNHINSITGVADLFWKLSAVVPLSLQQNEIMWNRKNN